MKDVKQMVNGQLFDTKKDTTIRKLGLMDFSGDENFSPELIDDALNSTGTFHRTIDIAGIAKRIQANKARYGGAKP